MKIGKYGISLGIALKLCINIVEIIRKLELLWKKCGSHTEAGNIMERNGMENV